MNRLLLLGLLAALALLAVDGDQPVAASPLPATPMIERLLPRELPDGAVRDPFFGAPPAPPPTESAAPVDRPRSTARAVPAFRILGKQEDDSGWSVFLTTPDGQGPVWVLRAGDTFNDHYRVSRLAPPELLIQRLDGPAVRRFDLGKEEE